MWAMIACCIALVLWTVLLSYMDRRNKKKREIDEISVIVDGKDVIVDGKE